MAPECKLISEFGDTNRKALLVDLSEEAVQSLAIDGNGEVDAQRLIDVLKAHFKDLSSCLDSQDYTAEELLRVIFDPNAGSDYTPQA